MSLLDRYVFSEWLKIFVLALAATLGILLLERLYDDLPDFIGWGATTWEVLKYFGLYTPSFLPTIIPISLLISLLFSLGNLHRNNEIVAMRSAGMNLWRITRSLWVAGAVLSALLLYLNARLVPWSVEQSRILKDNLHFASEEERVDKRYIGNIPLLCFDNQSEGRMWFMNNFSEYSYEGFGINVYQHDAYGRETGRVMAREGYFDDVDNHWVFIDGRDQKIDPASGEVYFSRPFEKKAYPDFTEDPVLMKTLSKKPQDLSYFELEMLLDKIPVESNPKMKSYEIRLMNILASPFRCLVVVGIAIPFAVAGVRTNPLVGVSKSVGLFVLYYVISSISRLLGEQELIPLAISAWLPLVLMLGLSVHLFRKVS
ncbi:LptF/LptG family permease [Ruficoccus amylovorans]|uniref:LptF/LptG family permease n=1 Tax=Ruficoccus amylovorans TaxID=1804625 RepID=A0A842HI19_9BACT|nr:LptF/LptG family permease [Ruficoccus amylovorans]MBC2596425.1 LptF/LptG family permease [Ruficoccus amylovorans]